MLAIFDTNTIVAVATPTGSGAIALIRLSGDDSIAIVNKIFRGKDLVNAVEQKVFFGQIVRGQEWVDEVLITVFRKPHSFTRENTVEISCHNSNYIIRTVLEMLLEQGARLAQPGEFSQRAFLNGRFDLTQVEAIADLIASDSKAAHRSAMNQMRGGFSKEIRGLREKLIEFAALVELELDFGEEDVEFANRQELLRLVAQLQATLLPLIQSFKLGNSLKDGIPTVIAGKPNAGKSTLLNTLLNEERAIVSDIPGTTRDVIEDEMVIEGIKFRLTDTAGLRQTEDVIEAMGVERTQQKMKQASLILYLFDGPRTELSELQEAVREIEALDVPYIIVGNKTDLLTGEMKSVLEREFPITWISAARRLGIDQLKEQLVKRVQESTFVAGDTIVTNARHYEHLSRTAEALERVVEKIGRQETSDWLALDIRDALHHLGQITGEITTDDLLDNIFSKFCIGK